VAVVLGVRLVDRWRHEVVFSTRYEEQGCPSEIKKRDESRMITLMPSPEYSHRGGPL